MDSSKKNEILSTIPGVILAVIFALPLPISMVFIPFFPTLFHALTGCYLSILSMLAARPFDSSYLLDLANALFYIITVLLAYLYPCTYLFAIGIPFKSLDIPFKAKNLSLLTFLPLLHIVVFIMFYLITTCFNGIYAEALDYLLDPLNYLNWLKYALESLPRKALKYALELLPNF